MTVSWNVANAQKQLRARTPPPTMRQVNAALVSAAVHAPAKGDELRAVQNPAPPPLAPSLSDLRTDHLSTELRVAWPGRDAPLLIREQQIFVEAIAAANYWVRHRRDKLGLSFVLVAGGLLPVCEITDHAGQKVDATAFDGYGCGKTTLARAMFASCQQIATPLSEWTPPTPNSLRYLANRLNISDNEAAAMLAAARQKSQHDKPAQVLPGGVWLTAPELMEQMDDKEFSVRELIGSPVTTKVVVIDDVGREGELRFSKRDETQLVEKQARYYRVINYCYELFQQGCGISLIVTSNLRLKALAEFLGGASWTRLLQMAPNGCVRDLTGVRNYRPYIRGE